MSDKLRDFIEQEKHQTHLLIAITMLSPPRGTDFPSQYQLVQKRYIHIRHDNARMWASAIPRRMLQGLILTNPYGDIGIQQKQIQKKLFRRTRQYDQLHAQLRRCLQAWMDLTRKLRHHRQQQQVFHQWRQEKQYHASLKTFKCRHHSQKYQTRSKIRDYHSKRYRLNKHN